MSDDNICPECGMDLPDHYENCPSGSVSITKERLQELEGYEFSSGELKLVAEEQSTKLTALQSKLSKAEAEVERLSSANRSSIKAMRLAVTWLEAASEDGYLDSEIKKINRAIDKAMQNKG